MTTLFKTTHKLLAIALLATLATCVVAQTPAADADSQAALAIAREELAEAAKRVAELQGDFDQDRVATRIQIESRIARRPVMGVLLAPDPQAGVRIAGVTPDGPAAKKGLKSGDRLISVNGKPIAGGDATQRLADARVRLNALDAKTPVAIGYARNGRTVAASIVPELDPRVFMWNSSDRTLGRYSGPVFIRRGDAGELQIEADAIEIETLGMSPPMRREIRTIGSTERCGKDGCEFPMLTEALRWNGLNLATVDAQLGRYFGTDSGVLVLSAGEDLAGLQAGDVIRKLDGKQVATPREAMAALRAKPAASDVQVEYLRDKEPAQAKIKVPKAMPFRIPAPPAPPAAPTTVPETLAAPQAPRAPPPPPSPG